MKRFAILDVTIPSDPTDRPSANRQFQRSGSIGSSSTGIRSTGMTISNAVRTYVSVAVHGHSNACCNSQHPVGHDLCTAGALAENRDYLYGSHLETGVQVFFKRAAWATRPHVLANQYRWCELDGRFDTLLFQELATNSKI